MRQRSQVIRRNHDGKARSRAHTGPRRRSAMGHEGPTGGALALRGPAHQLPEQLVDGIAPRMFCRNVAWRLFHSASEWSSWNMAAEGVGAMSTTVKLVAAAVVVLLIGGLAYWVLEGGWRSAAPQESPVVPPVVTAPAPPATTPTATPASPPTAPAPRATVPPAASSAATAPAPLAPEPAASTPTPPPAPTSTATPPPAAAPTDTASPAAALPARPAAPPPPPTSTPTAPASLPAEADMSEANRRTIQEALRRLDYYKGPVDGIFGPRTRAAIRRFQHQIDAEITGHLSAEEANRLTTRQ